jgi:hypothetical protein
VSWYGYKKVSLLAQTDSTSNRGQNIKSSHLATHTPDYKSGNLDINPNSMPKVHFLGIEKILDHISAKTFKAR